MHLGTTIYTMLYRDNVIDVVNELYKCTNYLLSDFSFTESCTISNLFNSFCMNVYVVSGYSILKLIMTYYIILIIV